MDTVELKRLHENEAGTFGEMRYKGQRICITLEEPWKDNEKQVSCIPKGVYVCKPHNGAHFKDVWEVTGVPDRQAILIHAGNTLRDTMGCILVGTVITDSGIGRSREALDKLRKILPDNFYLEVK